MPMAMPAPPDTRSKGWLVSVQTTERTDWYAVGVSDTSGAHDLVVEYCKAHLGHAVRLERPLTDREITEFLLTKRAESRPAEGKTNSETFTASWRFVQKGLSLTPPALDPIGCLINATDKRL
jgi:hypothetical protein